MTEQNLKRTPFYEEHIKKKARMVPFVGWEMPVQYSGVIEEHMAVRTKAGLFDVSHMGEVVVRGADALKYLQKITCNDVSALAVGQIQYTALTLPQGTFIDDFLLYKFADDLYFLVPNASNVDKDYDWMLKNTAGFKVEAKNLSADYGQLALQGPLAEKILLPLTELDLPEIRYYWFKEGKVIGKNCIVSRTGYTGEDGFEIYMAPEDGPAIYNAIMEKGRPLGLQPVGLGARDTLRLEAKMALYGNDIDDTTTVLEAGLGWICKLEKGDFIGRDVLLKQKEEGVTRKLAGFEMVDRGIARHGYPVIQNGKEIGHITSGSYSPYFKKNIGLAYLPVDMTEIGTEFTVRIREKDLRAVVVKTPFYKRAK